MTHPSEIQGFAPEVGAPVCLANARLVLPDQVVLGRITLADGLVQEITPGADVPAGAVDCGGDFILPGLVELHTDNLERHMEPRPEVAWPHLSAILAHDGELVSTGITTVFDAMRVGSIHTGSAGYGEYARAPGDRALGSARAQCLADHPFPAFACGDLFRKPCWRRWRNSPPRTA
jgi:Metal-dependent hydrolase involved in phosphonate metabolism